MEIYKNVGFHILAGFLFVLLIVIMGVVSTIVTVKTGLILGIIVIALAIGVYLISKKIPLPPDNSGFHKDGTHKE